MYKKLTVLLLLAGFAGVLSAKHIAYYDNSCRVAVPDLVAGVAQEIGYAGNYELVEPNKIGLQVNPWNGMIWFYANPPTPNNILNGMIWSYVKPQTQNNIMIVNPTWFNQLSQEEQKFLVARYLIGLEQAGGLLTLIKILPYLFLIVWFGLLFLIWFVVNQTGLRHRVRWQKMLVTYLVAVALNLTIMPKVQQKLTGYLGYRYEVGINQLVLAKLPNKPAAIAALKAVDQAIKAGIAEGHNLLKPTENIFAELAQDLEK